MTVFWLSSSGFYQSDGGTVTAIGTSSPWDNNRGIYFATVSEPRSRMSIIVDEFAAMVAKAKAPIAILIDAIRDARRCMPRLAAALPGSQRISRRAHRPRRRDVRHGDALLNVHRMPA